MLASKDNLEIYQSATGIWRGVKAALAEQPLWERCIFIFWLMGPILLIERTPQIYVVASGLAFARSVKRRNWSFLNDFWCGPHSCFSSSALFRLFCQSASIRWVKQQPIQISVICDGNSLLVRGRQTFPVRDACDDRTWHVFDVWHSGCRASLCRTEGREAYGHMVIWARWVSVRGVPAFLILVALTMSHSRLIASYATLAVLINLACQFLPEG